MARTNNLTNFLNDVSSAIKQKTGDSTPIPASEFDTEILSIETAGTYQTKSVTITENTTTTITPDTGYDAIEQLTITTNVPMSQLQSKSVTITSNGNIAVLPDTNYDGMTQVNLSVNVPSGGDIKLFETEQAMQADPNPSEGDLAVVYREELTAVTADSEFSSCTFPNTVVLPTAYSNDFWGMFRVVDESSGYFSGNVELSASRFRFNGYGDGAEIRVEYESQDGITYTRTDGGEELQDFGVAIKYEQMGEWDDTLGYFMKIGGNYFEGMYEYKSYENEEYAEAYSNVRYTNNDIVFNTTDVYISDLVELIHSKEEDIKSATGMSGGITDITIVKTAENQFTMYAFYGGSSYGQRAGGFVLYNNNLYAYGDNFTTNIYKFTINTSNNTVVYDGEINYDTTVTINTYTRYCVLLDNISPVFLIYQSGGTVYRNQREILYTSDNIGTNIKTYDIYTPTKATMYEYKLTFTQLDATADYVYGKTFYGKNGVEEGTLTANVDNSFADISAEIMYKIQQQYENMAPRVLTDNDKTINKNIYFIPIKKDGTLLLDTGNVTNMFEMFNSCTNLTTIPQLNTSNVTNMGSMFGGCTNLTTIPQLNTSNVTNMGSMFNNCTSLTTIPQLNTSNVTSMYRPFTGCTSLSNTSLNNILAMCTNATKVTSYKTLKDMGLTSAQATICQGLSNYSAFTAAGWTTGY